MKNHSSVIRLIGTALKTHLGFSVLLIVSILLSIFFSLLPPLILEEIINTLASGKQPLYSMALCYFLILAISGLLDSGKESLITAFGQKVTHQIRSAMAAKLTKLPSSYFIKTAPGVTTSCFVNDVNTVEQLFTSGVISMVSDLCRLLGIFFILFSKSMGLGLLLLFVTPLLFWLTRIFQKRILLSQTENRIAIGKTNQQIPETLKNMRTIRLLHRESFMLERYENSIDQSFHAQERSNFYDAVYSPLIVSVSALLIGILMAASVQNGAFQEFFGMSAGTAAAVISYVGSFFGPLESIGMELQNIQSAVAGVKRIHEFLEEPEQTIPQKTFPDPSDAIRFSAVSFRYQENEPDILQNFTCTISEGETVILTGRTGAGKSTLIKLIAGLYQPQKGTIQVFGQTPASLPEAEKRRWFGYVEQQFHLIPGSVADQVSLLDPQVSELQIRQALHFVGLDSLVKNLPEEIHTPCTKELFSQGQFQLLSIARAIVLDPKILLLDEITANLDSETEAMVLSALRAASQNRTVISISHRLYGEELQGQVRFLNLSFSGNTL